MIRLTLALALWAGIPALAGTGSVTLTRTANAAMHLVAHETGLAKVINMIAAETGTRIHHAIPSDAPTADADCVGSNVTQLLECVFDGQANLMARHIATNGDTEQDEIWLIAGSHQAAPKTLPPGNSTANRDPRGFTLPGTGNVPATARPGALDVILLQANNAEKPEQRRTAISALTFAQPLGDPRIHAVLEASLNDADPGIRAQALSALARREGSAAAPWLQQALADSDANVRLMAVDRATGDLAWLSMALDDPNLMVRSLAARKLSEAELAIAAH